MRFSPARLVALVTLLPALLSLAVVPGCAKQSEGERCGDETGSANDDCADGLTCTSKTLLVNNAANRCCYTDRVTDSRCDRSNGEAPSASAGGSSSGGSSSGGATASAGGGDSGGVDTSGTAGSGTAGASADAGAEGN